MFLDFINWSTVLSAIGNIILSSIPEEIFLVMFTLILLRQFDFLESKKEGGNKFKKRDIYEIAIPVLLVAVSSNIVRYSGLDVNYTFFITITVLFLSILFVCKLWTLKGIIKTLVATIVSSLVVVVIEIAYIPLVLSATQKTISDFNDSIFLNFVLALPERVVEYCLIVYMLVKKASFLKANIINPIVSSKILTSITIGILIFDMFLIFTMGKLIIFNRIIENFSIRMQSVVTVIIILFPILNLVAFVGGVYYTTNKEVYKRYIAKEMLKRIAEDLLAFTENNNYDKIKLALKDMEANVDDLYEENYRKEVNS